MKKTVLFLFLLSLAIACKDKSNGCKNCSVNTQKQGECTSLDDYNKETTITGKADWLRKFGGNVCVYTLYKNALKSHTIPDITKFTINNNSSFKKDWTEINTMTKGFSAYQKYLSFDLDTINPADIRINKIKTVSNFNDTIPCYSLPLLRAIAEENNFKVTFEFLNATLKNDLAEEVGIMIIIKTTSISIDAKGATKNIVTYYDYSDEPKLIPKTGLIMVEKPL